MWSQADLHKGPTTYWGGERSLRARFLLCTSANLRNFLYQTLKMISPAEARLGWYTQVLIN